MKQVRQNQVQGSKDWTSDLDARNSSSQQINGFEAYVLRWDLGDRKNRAVDKFMEIWLIIIASKIIFTKSSKR